MVKHLVTKTQKSEGVKSKTKIMLIIYLDVREVIQAEFLSQDQIIDQNVYILQRLMGSVREKKREL